MPHFPVIICIDQGVFGLSQVRVRFAPSPTGSLHIGGARTALFNWLYARANAGSFILRIEDTDQKRSVEGSIEEIMRGLRWLGLQWDEGPDVGGDYGPYVQSERLEHYQKWAQWLIDNGKAYKDYSTSEELERAREIAQKTGGGKIAGYERLHRFLSEEERAKFEAERDSYVVRLAMPLEGQIVANDAIRGKISFDADNLSDIVLLKSDGFPTYHLAMAVDDHFMEISHVMRSDEWIASLPMHAYLYQAFGWDSPDWVHLPVILNPNGKGKLSKRNESFQDGKFMVLVKVYEYIEAGYQPEAVVNWLTNIGWNFGDDQEFFSVDETIQRFSLEKINPSSSALPFSKLHSLNGDHIRAMATDAFVDAIMPLLTDKYGAIERDVVAKIAPQVQERVNPLHEVVDMLAFLFVQPFQPPSVDDLIPKKMDADGTKNILQRSYATLAGLEAFDPETQETAMRALVEEMGVKVGQVFGTVRWATMAQKVSPPLFDATAALGQAETLKRIQQSIDQL